MPVIACRQCRKILRYREVSDLPFFPFCSARCKLLDLGGWLDEKHGSPASRPPERRRKIQAGSRDNQGCGPAIPHSPGPGIPSRGHAGNSLDISLPAPLYSGRWIGTPFGLVLSGGNRPCGNTGRTGSTSSAASALRSTRARSSWGPSACTPATWRGVGERGVEAGGQGTEAHRPGHHHHRQPVLGPEPPAQRRRPRGGAVDHGDVGLARRRGQGMAGAGEMFGQHLCRGWDRRRRGTAGARRSWSSAGWRRPI